MLVLCALPEVIFQWILSFSSHDDSHYFFNSSKSLFADLKKRTIYFALNKEKSSQYIRDESFRNLLLSKVESGWNQIGVIIDSNDARLITVDVPIHRIFAPHTSDLSPELWVNYQSISCRCPRSLTSFPSLPKLKILDIEVYQSIPDLTPFSHLQQLTLRYMQANDVTALQQLQHIPNLILLSHFPQGTDFSILTSQKSLIIKSQFLVDVTAFRSIQKLALVGCDKVLDVRALYGIYDLTLAVMKVKDISGLGGHYRLTLSNIDVIGFDCLLHIPHVILRSTNISDVSVLRYAKSVFASSCSNIIDVSDLKYVKKIEISTKNELKGLKNLGEVPDLSLNFKQTPNKDELNDYTVELTDDLLSSFNNSSLQFSLFKSSISSLASFSRNIKHLTIGESKRFSSFLNEGQGSLLSYLSSLTLLNLKMVTVDGLGDIPTVHLISCHNIKSLKGLGRNYCVKVKYCWKLEDVSSLATVSVVKIDCCRLVKNVSCLSKVSRLKIINHVTSSKSLL